MEYRSRDEFQLFEWFDAIVFGVLHRFDDDAEMRDWLKRARITKGVTILKEPLGSNLMHLLRAERRPLPLVVQTHLHFENFVDEVIRRKFRHGDVIFKNRGFTFALKVDLLRAKGYLTKDLYHDLQLLNSLRNKFAHDLFFDIGSFDMSRFSYCDELANVYRRLVEVEETRPILNVYAFGAIAFRLLLRMTRRFEFIAELKVPPAAV